MNNKVKSLLHELNKYRDQMNCCYECIVHDLKSGERPQVDDLREFNEISIEFSSLTKALIQHFSGEATNEARE